MRFKDNLALQEQIKLRRQQGATVNDIAAEFPQYAHVTYKRFLKGTGKNYSREKMSKACKRGWENQSAEAKAKHIEHLRNLATGQKGKSISLSVSHLEKIRVWTASKENRARVAKQNEKKKKYTERCVRDILVKHNVGFTGDLSDSDNVITIIHCDGQRRRLQIKKFMRTGVIPPPKDMIQTKRNMAEARRRELGVTYEMMNSTTAKMWYQGFSWVQCFANMSTTLKNISRINQGLRLRTLLSGGYSISRACKEVGVSPCTYVNHFKQTHCTVEAVRTIKKFECQVKIDDTDVIYNRKLPGYSIRPDLRIENSRLIVEIDGPYSHSEEFRPRKYHNKRFHIYKSEGYSLLSFTTGDIVHKRAIVDSMIHTKLGRSQHIRAADCGLEVINIDTASAFFKQNHLMGSGAGDALALTINGEIFCALQYVIRKGSVRISRFCNKLNHTVTDGYARLLARLPTDKRVVHVIDARHEAGEDLLRLGFKLVSECISMWWVEKDRLVNRRKYLGNSGYDHGLKKYWDYGQLKYVKEPAS